MSQLAGIDRYQGMEQVLVLVLGYKRADTIIEDSVQIPHMLTYMVFALSLHIRARKVYTKYESSKLYFG